MRNTKSQMIEILSKALQKTEAEIAKDINRPRYFDAQAAKDYGIIDKVKNLTKRDD
jgi:ATP-dependent Clp protease protease subunit